MLRARDDGRLYRRSRDEARAEADPSRTQVNRASSAGRCSRLGLNRFSIACHDTKSAPKHCGSSRARGGATATRNDDDGYRDG
ncbi:unnamed protein product [Leptosia nina]|uniref:Uncharacterized protein n=1 Tax=Leptosia nina TaxID=320188 RepID=A0AAV1K3U8_9NEOP